MTTATLVKNVIDYDAVNQINVLTERVKKRKHEVETAPLWISGKRARSFTESWKQTEAEPLPVRWALAFTRVLKESDIIIRDGELIVGSETKYIRSAEVVVEQSPYEILKALENKHYTTMSEVMLASLDKQDEASMEESAKYWVGRSVRDVVHGAWRRRLGEKYGELQDQGIRVLADTVGVSGKVQAVFNANRLNEGLNGVIARARKEKERMIKSIHDGPTPSKVYYHKLAVLDSIIIVSEAVIRYAKKHAELAKKLARTESDPVRKKELEIIAENCEWVPANPPRNFFEALQFYWFVHMGFKKEAPMPAGCCPGLMDRYMLPYYEKDLEDGTFTRQEMAEMLGCFWVKLNELQSFHGSLFTKEAAGSLLQQITIGGQTPDGRDATNEFSYLLLEIARQMKMPQPGIYIRWHNGIDHRFMIKAIETNRETQGGIPAFLNDNAAIRNYLASGVAYNDAFRFVAAGCLSYTLGDVNTPVRMPLYINIPKVLEIALNDGIDPRTGIKAGPQTGDVTKFTSIEQIYDAFWKQISSVVDKAVKDYYIGFIAKEEYLFAPFTSAILEDCIEKGLDSLEGGVRYPQLNVSFGQRGCVDVADSLAAIKKLVFNDKKLTMSELLKALNADWEGYEKIRQMCVQAPKYGNDDDYVDEIFNMVSLKVNDTFRTKPNPWTGTSWRVTRPALTGHYYLGEVVGALPNGRKAGTPLYDGALSALAGSDVNGPTSLIKSATKVNHFKPEMDSLVLNMKLTATVLQSQEAIENMLALLKTFFDRGGWHIQFNIINREDLLAAKKNPEQWRHLIVRVAGYSAYFVDLPDAIKDEIIARTEHAL